MASRQQWLDAGLSTLAEHGVHALTIDRLARELGLTKGSFYHHFGGMDGYRTALLAHFEAAYTTRYIDEVSQVADPKARLERLMDLLLDEEEDWGLEVAVRAWAQQDPVARAAQERVDRIRIDFLEGLIGELRGGRDGAEAARMGRLLYLILIGAGHVLPPVRPAELRELYDLVLR